MQRDITDFNDRYVIPYIGAKTFYWMKQLAGKKGKRQLSSSQQLAIVSILSVYCQQIAHTLFFPFPASGLPSRRKFFLSLRICGRCIIAFSAAAVWRFLAEKAVLAARQCRSRSGRTRAGTPWAEAPAVLCVLRSCKIGLCPVLCCCLRPVARAEPLEAIVLAGWLQAGLREGKGSMICTPVSPKIS